MASSVVNLAVEIRFRRGALPALVAVNAVWHGLLRRPLWVPLWAFRTRMVYRPHNQTKEVSRHG